MTMTSYEQHEALADYFMQRYPGFPDMMGYAARQELARQRAEDKRKAETEKQNESQPQTATRDGHEI